MTTTIRAFYRATKVNTAQPPYDTIHLKVFYPGLIPDQPPPDQDLIPVDTQDAPFPVVIFLSGFNCHPNMYEWLAISLASRGMVVITFSWIEEYSPDIVSLTPGFNIDNWKPNNYGKKSSSSTLPAIINELEKLNRSGHLAGMLDLKNIILGGHSAGGRIAMENADPKYYPVAAAFSYGASSVAPVMLGYEPGKILPLPNRKPLLIIGGTRDGVIGKMSSNYGFSSDPNEAVEKTFEEGILGGRNDSYLLLLEGANHFTISHPMDQTTANPFLDYPATQPENELRSLMIEIIGLFIDTHVRKKLTAKDSLNQYLTTQHPLIASIQQK